MGLMDKMRGLKDRYGGDFDSMKQRYEELRSKEQSGDINNDERSELTKLKDRFFK